MARILIVDDTRISREVLRSVLQSEGHEVIGEAVNGEDGFEKYMDLQPDIVTMDITMPVMDGVSSLKKIREYDPDAKIIMVTSAGQNSKLAECMASGAADFVIKPWDASDLLFSVSMAVDAE